MKYYRGHFRISRFILSRKTNVLYVIYKDNIYYPLKNSVMSDFFEWETSNGLGSGMVPEVCNVRLREIKNMYELETGKIPVLVNVDKYPNTWLFRVEFLYWLDKEVEAFRQKMILMESKRRKI